MQGWLFLTFIMVGSLVGVTGMRQFFVEPLSDLSVNAIWFLLQILPLLLCLPAALRGQLKGMFFLCLVSTLYFIHGVLIVFDPELFTGQSQSYFYRWLCAPLRPCSCASFASSMPLKGPMSQRAWSPTLRLSE